MLTALAIFAALTAIVQVVMSFARTRPEDAKQSLGEWAKSFHLDRLARWLNAHRADQWVLRYGPKLRFAAVIAFSFVGGWVASSYFVSPTIAQLKQ